MNFILGIHCIGKGTKSINKERRKNFELGFHETMIVPGSSIKLKSISHTKKKPARFGSINRQFLVDYGHFAM